MTQAHVLQYLDVCERTSARGEISLLSGAYRAAMRAGHVSFNPCIGARSDKPRSKRDRYITDDELAAVRAVASPLLAVAIDLAYLTGLRVSDVCALRWNSFEAGGHVRTAKTGARTRYTLTDDLRAVLAEARALQGDLPCLYALSINGRKVSRYMIGKWWRAACDKAGVADAHWHDIRAKAGTDADAAGQDATALLGHQSAQTTKVYLRGKKIVEVQPVRRRKT